MGLNVGWTSWHTNVLKKLDFLHLFTKSPQEEYNEKQTALQQQQFEYQKWYDANNIQLKTQDAMKAGINPLVATNGNTSSVTATSQPQMPDNSNAAGMNLLSDMVGKIISHNEHKDELDLENRKLKLAQKQQDIDDSNQQTYFNILKARAGADVTRTEIYRDLALIQGQESKTRQKSMAHDLLIRVRDGYGTQSSIYRKVAGELASLLNVPVKAFDEFLDNVHEEKKRKMKKSTTVPSVLNKTRTNSFEAYKKALESGYDGDFEDFYNMSRGYK